MRDNIDTVWMLKFAFGFVIGNVVGLFAAGFVIKLLGIG